MPPQNRKHRCIVAPEQVCAVFPHVLSHSLLALLDLHRRRFPFLACRLGRLPTPPVLTLQIGLQLLAITLRI